MKPLPGASLYLVLALLDVEQHGYALMGRVSELADGPRHPLCHPQPACRRASPLPACRAVVWRLSDAVAAIAASTPTRRSKATTCVQVEGLMPLAAVVASPEPTHGAAVGGGGRRTHTSTSPLGDVA